MRAGRTLPVLIAFLAGATAASAESLTIDRDHSTVGFSVRHIFTRVTGRFQDFEGTIEFDEKDLSSASVSIRIRVASVDTNVEARDKDLRSKRFFDAEKFQTLDFESTSVSKGTGGKFRITGFLTMHGVKKEVVLDAEFFGKGKDPWGNLRYGFHAETAVSREEFGMKWNEVLETGGVLVGDEVTITLDIEAVPVE